MTATSYDPPAASARPNHGPVIPGPVLLSVTGPASQRRSTVAVRVVLAIPHLLALSVLGIAASVAAVIGWFYALFTGGLPRFAANYLSGYLGWSCRVAAYSLLLTDEYPPFAFEDAVYPVRAAVCPGKLKRLTVLSRIILAIPAGIVATLLVCGVMTIVIFITWLIALVTGKLPAALHQALTAVLRYTVRYNGYVYLLTSIYPAGLFGDDPVPQTGQPSNWQLVLSADARRLVGLFLVLGLLVAAGGGALAGVAVNSKVQRDRAINQLYADVTLHNRAVAQFNRTVARARAADNQVGNAINQVTGAHVTFVDAVDSPDADSSDCTTLSCFDLTSLPVARAFAAFGRTLSATPLPASSAAIGKRLATDTTNTEQDWMKMTQAASFTSSDNLTNDAEVNGGRFDNDYAALVNSLNQEADTLGNQDIALDQQATALNHTTAALNGRAATLNVQVSPRIAQDAS